MKENHKLIINNITKETALLESVEWDTEVLKEVYKYLDLHFQGDSIISPALLLKEVEEKFGLNCAEVLRDMFVKVSLSHGLFIHDPDVEN